MRLHNVITQAQSQPGSRACGFCCKEWLKDFSLLFFGNTAAIICNTYFNFVVVFRCNRNRCLKTLHLQPFAFH